MVVLTDSKKAITTFAFIIFLAGLLLYTYLGIYNRYWADDWCYNADLRELGFIDTLKGYTYITTYASNRYALTLFSGIFYYLGIFGIQIMSPLNIILLASFIYWCLINLKQIASHSITNGSLAIIALITTYYTLYLAPHLYQSVYWRSGSLPYFEPIVMGVLTIALLTHQGLREKPSTALTITVALISFIAGGFSESACATLTTVLAIYTALSWFFRKQKWALQSLPAALTALAASLISMFVLISSPTTTDRVALYGQSASLVELPSLLLEFSYGFVRSSFTDLPLPHLAIIGTTFILGYLLVTHDNISVSTKTVAIIMLVTVTITFILIASSFAPSAYIEKVPPHPRTRIIPRFILTLALTCISWALGALASRIARSKIFHQLALLLFVLTAFYSIRSIFIAGRNIPIYSDRARAWDVRNEYINTAISNGDDIIYVNAIDGLPVGNIRDFDAKGQGRPGYWINQCAARFYGVNEINISTP